MVDEIISWLHRTVGNTIDLGFPEAVHIEQGTVNAYLSGARELASFSRIERRGIGARLRHVMQLATERDGFSSLCLMADRSVGVLVLASNRTRSERVRGLLNFCTLAYCKRDLQLSKVVGVATEPAREAARTFDVCVLADEPFPPDEKRDRALTNGRPFREEVR